MYIYLQLEDGGILSFLPELSLEISGPRPVES